MSEPSSHDCQSPGDPDDPQIPAGTYRVLGQIEVYTCVEVYEDGTLRVRGSRINLDSHEIDLPGAAFDSQGREVPAEIAKALAYELEFEGYPWEASSGAVLG